MSWKKKAIREILLFACTGLVSFAFWCLVAVITEQHVITREYLYHKEGVGFLITMALIYFLRINAWSHRTKISEKQASVDLDTPYVAAQSRTLSIHEERIPSDRTGPGHTPEKNADFPQKPV